jgi:hypothetical protein
MKTNQSYATENRRAERTWCVRYSGRILICVASPPVSQTCQVLFDLRILPPPAEMGCPATTLPFMRSKLYPHLPDSVEPLSG